MARPFHGNWAYKAIEEHVKPGGSRQAITDALTSHPRFQAVIQNVLDNYPPDPIPPGGDPAEAIIGDLSSALTEPGWS